MSRVALITRNLMDASKVRAALSETVVTRDVGDEKLLDADLILLDLTTQVPPEEVVALGPPVIAYGPHIDVDGLESARAAGCRDALPRSQLFSRLKDLV